MVIYIMLVAWVLYPILLLIGSPGSGKSMLAKRMPSILPPLTFQESLETTNVHSISGLLDRKTPLITKRPFRSPHHTISSAGLAGGGSVPRPGEISLAHNGLLFLDELAEFDRRTLEIMRQPLEDRIVTISRASGTVTYPCSIMLIGAMNPCPCGYYGHPKRKCTCGPKQVKNYLSKISGPMLDSIGHTQKIYIHKKSEELRNVLQNLGCILMCIYSKVNKIAKK